MSAMTCRLDNPIPCAGRTRANAVGPGMWYSDVGQTWYSATPEGMLACTHCPYCGGVLPMMGSGESTLRLIDRALAEPDDEC